MRALSVAAALIAALILFGHWSGSQPDRDEVSAARELLGIELESRMIDVGDVRLHTILAGPADGPPVLLLHGFPELWFAWRGPMAVLARAGFRVIVPDQRGYNRSDKPPEVEAYRIDALVGDVAGLVRALGYERVHLAGHDLGGAVAWAFVLAHPELVERFAVLGTAHPQVWQLEPEDGQDEEDTVSWYRTFMQIPWLPGYAARVANWRLLASSLRDSAEPGAFPDESFDYYRSAWNRDDAIHTMTHWYRAAFRYEEPLEGEQRVSLPTLVMVSEDDAFISGFHTRASMQFLDDGRLLELGSGTHWVIQEEPDRIGRILVEFFREALAG